MDSIFSIPDGKAVGDSTREGEEMYPLYIPDTTVGEFDDFLQWLYRAQWVALGSDVAVLERICTHLLKLMHKWEIEVAKDYAISLLRTIDIPLARRLQLAGKFGITQWVEPTVAKIFKKKITALTHFDVEAMGWPVFMMLVKAQESMDVETRRTALVPPQMLKDPSW
ncbi:hypothetical protein DFH08DRAFT_962213 [Mycena albidolilacea]|uniref:BTB domain-containing protein n=1 Tax=Mycena albidolilacea TaxID=1033008 RepID=A0AAD6ZZI3_9AGAR|nr:hypothetical protein DFH08DRAFT_962213 [Mycena albidolilacea]